MLPPHEEPRLYPPSYVEDLEGEIEGLEGEIKKNLWKRDQLLQKRAQLLGICAATIETPLSPFRAFFPRNAVNPGHNTRERPLSLLRGVAKFGLRVIGFFLD